jgi:hypothetical protein
MITYRNFTDSEGRVDWKAYEEAQKQAGEACFKCGRLRSSVAPEPPPWHCARCLDLERPGIAQHDRYVRCPGCKHSWTPGGGDYSELFAEGSHETACPQCDCSFQVRTLVSFTFMSPALVDRKDDDP